MSSFSRLRGFAVSQTSAVSLALQQRTLALLRSYVLKNLPHRPVSQSGLHSADRERHCRVRIGREPAAIETNSNSSPIDAIKRSLCEGEREVVNERLKIARINLQRYLNQTSSKSSSHTDLSAAASDITLPTIGLCCSGGGYRAMLSTMGSLRASQELGLFDSATYIAGLSGSTWAMSQIYANEKHLRERKHEIERLQRHPHFPPSSAAPASAHSFYSPINLAQLSKELQVKISTNLFRNVPLTYIKSCLIDKWSLYQDAKPTDTQLPPSTSVPYSSSDSPPGASSTAASSSSHAAPEASAASCDVSSFSLSSFESLLKNSIGLSDSFGWCLSHKLLHHNALVDSTTHHSSHSTPHHHHPRLSDQISLLHRVSLPYPIYTAMTFSGEQWEFSPHEVGLGAPYDCFIPSWSLGREWKGGRLASTDSTHPHPPNAISFGLLLSCFASAFPTRIGRILEELIYTSSQASHEPFLKLIHKILHHEYIQIGNKSALTPHGFPNFLKGLDHTPEYSTRDIQHLPRSLLESDTLNVMDAGLMFNLPFPPLLHPSRGIDLIIAFDGSSPPEVNSCESMRLGSLYAKKVGLPFPNIDKSIQPLNPPHGYHPDQSVSAPASNASPSNDSSDSLAATADDSIDRSLIRASNSIVSIFEGDIARGIPTIIYLPLITNPKVQIDCEGRLVQPMTTAAAVSSSSSPNSSHPFDPRANFLSGGFCTTLNFQYQLHESEVLMKLTETNTYEAQEVIRQTIQKIHEQKKRLKTKSMI